MNILYGVSGDGYGHSSRALVVANYLKKKGHKVKILTYGQAYKVLKSQFDCLKISGMTLVFNKGVLDKGQTFKQNSREVSKNILKVKKFHQLIKSFKPDLCISDFEPIVPILSYLNKLPLISLDNQHRITNLEFKVPKKYHRDYLRAKAVIKAFILKADCFIIASFSSAAIKKKKTFVVSPIIRESVKKIKPKYGNKILVYLTRKDSRVLKVLKNINENFVIYGYNANKKDKNLTFKTRKTFLQDLANCKAIIAGSGFTLMSEALYLNKPYFAIPLKGQFEQVLNSLFLKQAEFGDYSDSLEEKDIIYFLYNLEKYKKNLKKYKFDFNKLFKVLDQQLKKVEKHNK